MELLDGVLIKMSPQGVIHAWSVQQLAQPLTLSLAGQALVRAQSPFAASDLSLPEPDIAVVPLDTPRDDHPTQALLLVEVSGSSLDKDRHAKARLYAMSGVAEYWVVNLTAQAIEVYSQPAEGCYGRRHTYRQGETIGLVGLTGWGLRWEKLFERGWRYDVVAVHVCLTRAEEASGLGGRSSNLESRATGVAAVWDGVACWRGLLCW